MSTGMEELKRRMEILLGAKPEAAEDESMKADAEKTATSLVKKEKVAAAGGQLVGAAFAFIGEMLADPVKRRRPGRAGRCVQSQIGRLHGENGGWPVEHDTSPCPTKLFWTPWPDPWPVSWGWG